MWISITTLRLKVKQMEKVSEESTYSLAAMLEAKNTAFDKVWDKAFALAQK